MGGTPLHPPRRTIPPEIRHRGLGPTLRGPRRAHLRTPLRHKQAASLPTPSSPHPFRETQRPTARSRPLLRRARPSSLRKPTAWKRRNRRPPQQVIRAQQTDVLPRHRRHRLRSGTALLILHPRPRMPRRRKPGKRRLGTIRKHRQHASPRRSPRAPQPPLDRETGPPRRLPHRRPPLP